MNRRFQSSTSRKACLCPGFSSELKTVFIAFSGNFRQTLSMTKSYGLGAIVCAAFTLTASGQSFAELGIV
jgi:hypothetical protein